MHGVPHSQQTPTLCPAPQALSLCFAQKEEHFPSRLIDVGGSVEDGGALKELGCRPPIVVLGVLTEQLPGEEVVLPQGAWSSALGTGQRKSDLAKSSWLVGVAETELHRAWGSFVQVPSLPLCPLPFQGLMGR
jgi:hypothetical protein